MWLSVHKTLVPDFVVSDPKSAPVWEITGAEFSKSTTHTADGISIRFPRVTKIRNDKDWKTATNLQELKKLVAASNETSEMKSKPSTSTNKDDDVMETDKKPGTSGEAVDDKKSRGQKRKSEDAASEEETSSKKAKPMCKYGTKCYQQSRKHGDKNTSEDAEKKQSDSTLPSIFTGAKIIICDDIEDKKKLKRYIIAYDGVIIPEYQKSEATHVITSKADTTHSAEFLVKPEWVWESIKAIQMQPEEDFAP